MISVVIPVYNAQRFIAKAVDSALLQKQVSEILLVEDGSNDGSYRLCKQILANHPSTIRILTHPGRKNEGAGASRNLGILQTRNQLIAFLDADDFYLPNRFDNDLKILMSNGDIDGVYNALGVHVYDEREKNRVQNPLTTVSHWIDPKELFEKMSPIGNSGYFSGNTLTVRKALFDRAGFFDTTLELSQDTHMWVKMAAKGSLLSGIIDRPVAMRGVHTNNRVKNIQKFMYYRPILFTSLLRWADANEVCIERKLLLWQLALKHHWAYLHNCGKGKFSIKMGLIYFFLKNYAKSPYLAQKPEYVFHYLIRFPKKTG